MTTLRCCILFKCYKFQYYTEKQPRSKYVASERLLKYNVQCGTVFIYCIVTFPFGIR